MIEKEEENESSEILNKERRLLRRIISMISRLKEEISG